jgi:hypothetical protein
MNAALATPITLDAGPYHAGCEGEQPFVVEMDALPLAALAEDAQRACRVYEFLSIRRPGDVLPYLRIRLENVQGCVRKDFLEAGERLYWGNPDCGKDYLPLPDFDRLFSWEGDDTSFASECWLPFRQRKFWREKMLELLAWVQVRQSKLRESEDPLIQGEIRMINAGAHRRDFFSAIERSCRVERLVPEQTTLPASLFAALNDLVQRDNVQSVSCPFRDYWLWHRLVVEQLKRAEATGLDPEVAFTLSGPETGIWPAPDADWGGDVHTPYEGACGADLFIKPDWRTSFPERDMEGCSLSGIFFHIAHPMMGTICHFALTQEDLGELACATRKEIGDGWVLYESNRPYVPNPRGKPHLQQKENDHE